MAGAATGGASAQVGLQIKLSNAAEVRKQLADILGSVTGATGRVGGTASPGQNTAAPIPPSSMQGTGAGTVVTGGGAAAIGGPQGGPQGGGGGAGAAFVGAAGGAFLGTQFGQLTQALKSAMSTSLRAAFEPNATDLEIQTRAAAAGLQGLPMVGGAASSIFQSTVSPQVGVQQGVQAQLNEMFGPAFQGIGARLGSAATPEQIKAAVQSELGPQIEAMRATIAAQERGREFGSQYLAESANAGLNVGEAMTFALERASGIIAATMGAQTEALKLNTSALEALKGLPVVGGMVR